MPYFPLVVLYAKDYVKDTGIGTLIAQTLPYSMCFLITWTLFLMVYWLVLGWPLELGPSGPAPYVYPSGWQRDHSHMVVPVRPHVYKPEAGTKALSCPSLALQACTRGPNIQSTVPLNLEPRGNISLPQPSGQNHI